MFQLSFFATGHKAINAICSFPFFLCSQLVPKWYSSHPGESVLLVVLLVFCYCSFSEDFTMEYRDIQVSTENPMGSRHAPLHLIV